MKYSISKIYSFASRFEKAAQATQSTTSLYEYEKSGLLDLAPYNGKRAKPGFSLTGKPYPSGYIGGFANDGSGLPTGFDDDVAVDSGMTSNEINSWVGVYFGEPDPEKLVMAAQMFGKFPIAAKILADKAEYIRRYRKIPMDAGQKMERM